MRDASYADFDTFKKKRKNIFICEVLNLEVFNTIYMNSHPQNAIKSFNSLNEILKSSKF